MYKVLQIGGKDYKLEYSIEASLYADCTASLTGLMTEIQIAGDSKDIKRIVSELSNIPQTTLTIFYAGLMEHHGVHPDGDGSVPDIQTAKHLIAQYLKEHSEDDTGNFFGIMQMCIEQMGEDGFFKLTGLEGMMNQFSQTAKPNRATRRAEAKASGK
jgi:hypothetical protein